MSHWDKLVVHRRVAFLSAGPTAGTEGLNWIKVRSTDNRTQNRDLRRPATQSRMQHNISYGTQKVGCGGSDAICSASVVSGC